MNKYDALDRVIVGLDSLVEASGIQKCRLAISLVQQIGELKKALSEEDAAHKAQIEVLQNELKAREA